MNSNSSKNKVRNYSFSQSKRLPLVKMTEVNNIKVPSVAGSCYHAIICALSEYKNSFVPWNKINELVEKYMCQYGGAESWEKFKFKKGVKNYQQRIKDNTHTLTRTGKDCYGYRLHELGMAIYFFKDGAMLLTGGQFKKNGSSYELKFPDGRGLQVRYKGTTMTSKEYKRFAETGLINSSALVLDSEGIKKVRRGSKTPVLNQNERSQMMIVEIELDEKFDQNTAIRLESMGLVVEDVRGSKLMGKIPSDKLVALSKDPDVVKVKIDQHALPKNIL